jgi:hypothetical protein
MAGAQVPKISEGEWLAEDEQMWGELTVAPDLTDPGTLVKTRVRSEVGDYRKFYANVRDTVLGNAKLEVSAEDGSRAIRALELARVSSLESRTIDF